MSFFRIDRLRTLVDEVVRIKLITTSPSLFKHSPKVTLYSYVDNKGSRYSSVNHFVVEPEHTAPPAVVATIDLHKSPSVSGDYVGVEPMGFMWSMRPEAGHKPGARLLVRDTSKSLKVNFKAYHDHLTLQDVHTENADLFLSEEEKLKYSSVAHEPFASASLERTYLSPNVERIPVQQGRLRGTLFVPRDVPICPGIIDMFGMGGGNMEFRAAMLASKGFVTFSLAYFGFSDLPQMYTIQDMNYFEEAVDFLINHPKVMAHNKATNQTTPSVGVVGTCKGGEIACLMACLFGNKIKATAIINAYAFHSTPEKCFYNYPTASKQQPFYLSPPSTLPNFELIVDRYKGARIFAPYYMNVDLKYIYPIENAKCDFLYFCSIDDQCIPMDSGDRLMARLEQFGNKDGPSMEVVRYPGAGHLLEPPYSPLCDIAYIKGFDLMYYGGNAKQHNMAQCLYWQKLQTFFHTKLNTFYQTSDVNNN